MNKLIKTEDLIPMILPLDVLLTNKYNNPFAGKTDDYINSYLHDVKYFEYFDLPIVYKQETLWTNTPQEYLVLTNVQEVETARALGLTEMKVLEMDDTKFSETDALRFSIHRSSFQSLSNESRYYGFKKIMEGIKKDEDWAASIITPTGKTIEKVAVVSKMSVGTIHKYITVGDYNKDLLIQADSKSTTIDKQYQKIMDAKPNSEKQKNKRLNRRSRMEGINKQYEFVPRLKFPVPEFKLEISIKEVDHAGMHQINVELNNIDLDGFNFNVTDEGKEITGIELTSKTDPLGIKITIPNILEYYKSKGFRVESILPKFDKKTLLATLPKYKDILKIDKLTPTSEPKETDVNKNSNIDDAIKGLVTLGIAKTKADAAVKKAMGDNSTLSDVGEIIKIAIHIAKEM